jgi:hypothetical protein
VLLDGKGLNGGMPENKCIVNESETFWDNLEKKKGIH